MSVRIATAAVLLGALALGSPGSGHGSDYQVSLTLEPRTTAVDRLVELRIEVEGGGLGFLRAAAHFELENLEVFDGPFRSERLRFAFGEAQRTATLRWRLRPVAPGPAAVRNLEVEVRGRRLELSDQTVEVVEGRGAPEPPPRREEAVDPFGDLFERPGREQPELEPQRVAEPQVFLRAELQPRRPYVGQQTRYTLYLYTQADVESIHPQELPSFHGFWVAGTDRDGNRQTEMVEVDGQRLARATLFERVLFPMRPGTFEVDPAQVELMARRTYVIGSGARFTRPERLRRGSDPLQVEVRPLPVAPDGFSGAVGRFRLEADLEPHRLEVGEAAVLTLTLSGSGNVEALPPPALPELPGCRTYPPQESSRQEWRDGDLIGVRTFQYVLVPESARKWSLPPIELPFFDPGPERYDVASTRPLELDVLPARLLDPPAVGEEAARPPAFAVAAPAAAPEDRRGWAPWLLILPVGALVLFLLARRRRERASPALAEFERALGGGRPGRSPRRVARQLEAAWRGLLKATWGLDHDLPARRWPEALASRGAAAEEVAELHDLVEELQELRLLPELAALEGPLRDLRTRSLALARRLTAPTAGPRRGKGDVAES